MVSAMIKMMAMSGIIVFSLTRCAPVAVIGGGAAVGTLLMREKPVGETITDTALSAKVKKALYRLNPDIDARVGVNVQEGEVLLTGTLPTFEEKVAAEKVVWKVKNVKRVYNDIEISDRIPLHNYAKDAWITSQIKTKLLAIPSIRSINYSIKTVNNVVYVFGIAQSEDELKHALNVMAHTRGVIRVMSYVRLVDSKTNL